MSETTAQILADILVGLGRLEGQMDGMLASLNRTIATLDNAGRPDLAPSFSDA